MWGERPAELQCKGAGGGSSAGRENPGPPGVLLGPRERDWACSVPSLAIRTSFIWDGLSPLCLSYIAAFSNTVLSIWNLSLILHNIS